MPDILLNVLNGASKRLKDMGDGTVAEVFYSANPISDVGIQYRNTAIGAANSVAVMSGATVQAVTAKATAGRLIGLVLQNSASTLRSFKLFNAAPVTLGTMAALFELDVPSGGSITLGFEGGIGFSNAMSFAVTSAKGLTDITANGLAANDVSGVLIYA